MKVNKIHDFNIYKEAEFVKVQDKFKRDIVLKNSFNEEKLKLVAGVDLAYWEENNKQYGTCCIVVIDYNSKEVVEKVNSVGEINVPYVAGFLAFRELPLVIEAVEKLTVEPDIFMFDGNGYLHYNHMGIATHASFFVDKPTIGVAKSYLKINGINFDMPENRVNAFTDIKIDGETYGRTLRTKENIKPIFISCGNFIDLNTCTNIVINLVDKESRLPIPVRLADLETHRVRSTIIK